jgi:hypothetical protein
MRQSPSRPPAASFGSQLLCTSLETRRPLLAPLQRRQRRLPSPTAACRRSTRLRWRGAAAESRIPRMAGLPSWPRRRPQTTHPPPNPCPCPPGRQVALPPSRRSSSRSSRSTTSGTTSQSLLWTCRGAAALLIRCRVDLDIECAIPGGKEGQAMDRPASSKPVACLEGTSGICRSDPRGAGRPMFWWGCRGQQSVGQCCKGSLRSAWP